MILLLSEHRLLDGLTGMGRFTFLQGVQFVQPFDEEQVGQLFDDREGVGDAAGPHGVPDAVDFRFDFTGDHEVP
jgi:hypothetical protein